MDVRNMAVQGADPYDSRELLAGMEHHLMHSIGRMPSGARLTDWRLALSLAVRDRIMVPWLRTAERINAEGRKRVCYLSMEFLTGRFLEDAIANLGIGEAAQEASAALGLDHGELLADEPDAALGNGGLGRLAACYLESMSSIGVAGTGYGIRFAHGLFRQGFDDGWQAEEAENWLAQRNVWEFERSDAAFEVGFGGTVERTGKGAVWTPDETVRAVAFDMPIVGWRGRWVNTLRLWSAKPARELDFEAFNRGDFIGARARAIRAETISRVLYPDDTTPQGRELRFRQEYFFTSASLRDILRRLEADGENPEALPGKVAIQLNDTHPAIAGPELVRLLTDGKGLEFDAAFDIARNTLHYTNHTLMPEALECWPIELMERVLPRHSELIGRIDERHCRDRAAAGRRRSSAVGIRHGGEVRMGELAFVMARRVNGVSALHTKLMKRSVFSELHGLYPDRILNQTNGVTPRRWLHGCNLELRNLLTEAIGDGWVGDLERLSEIAPLAEDATFRRRFMAAKRTNKARLADWSGTALGQVIDPDAIVRCPDQAVPRIQAAAPQPARDGGALERDAPQPRFRPGAAREDFRRKGRARLPDGETDHQADQRRCPGDQFRPGDAGTDHDPVSAELQCLHGRALHTGGGPVRADFDRGQGGVGHRQHEARAERGTHNRDTGRCQHRDRRTGRKREHLHLRHVRGRGRGAATRPSA